MSKHIKKMSGPRKLRSVHGYYRKGNYVRPHTRRIR